MDDLTTMISDRVHVLPNYIVVHPCVGICTFHYYEDASDYIYDVGDMFDLNSIGVLKSRGVVYHMNIDANYALYGDDMP